MNGEHKKPVESLSEETVAFCRGNDVAAADLPKDMPDSFFQGLEKKS